MRQLPQSASYVVTFKAFLASDHVSPATGKTIAITISKAGGAFANPNAGATNATEIANGWYKVTLDATDTNTVGDLVVRGTEGTIDPAEQVCQVGSVADVVLDRTAGVETDWTVRQALRVVLGVLAGPTTGMGTAAAVLKNPADTKNRVSATVDADGNRSAITYDKS